MLFTITREQYLKYRDIADECRQYIIDKLPQLCEVVDTFNRYFGPEHVDIYGAGFREKSLLLTLLEDYEESNKMVQKPLTEFLDEEFNNNSELMFDLAIYVHWPVVTVTNERGQSVDITDLYAKVSISPTGRLVRRFQLTRATYSYEQYSSGYLHSHISGIYSNPSIFQDPCLGSGPLRRTQETLSSFGEHDNLWDLFCVELDRYVHVESMAGGPYRHLDRIGTNSMMELNYTGFRREVLRPINSDGDLKLLFRRFFKYVLIRKKMRFALSNGMYTSAYTNTEWILKLSKVFLKFLAMINSIEEPAITVGRLVRDNLLILVKLNNGSLYTTQAIGRRMINYMDFNNQFVLYFKGETVTSHVYDPIEYADNSYYVLNPVLALAFQDQCINYLNIYEHEKERNIIQDNQEESEISGGSSNRSKNTFSNYSTGEARVVISL